jgi:hypothetical protein
MGVVTERAESRRALSPPSSAAAQQRSSAAAQQRAALRLVQRSRHEPPDCRRVVVGVDGAPGSAAALQRAVSRARQRNAMLDVVYVLPDGADARASTMARVMLGEFCRQACPYGAGVPVRLRVERGDPEVVLLLVSAGAELLITRHPPLQN